jgi:hypothetical protein
LKGRAVSDTAELGIEVIVDPVTGEIIDEKKLALQLLEQSQEQGVGPIGPGGLLSGLTKTVLETALEAELTEHLGHEHGQTPAPTAGAGPAERCGCDHPGTRHYRCQ